MPKTSNAREWQRAMRTWRKAKRGASHDDAVNNFAVKSLFRAIRLTPAASKGKFPLNATANPAKDRSKWSYKNRIFYALATGYRRSGGYWAKHRGVYKGEGVADEAKRIYSKRRRGSGAIKAGFFKPINDMGKATRARPFAGGEASKSKGKKAVRGNMRASSLNNVEASGTIARLPMERAMGQIVREEHAWAIRRLQKANNRFSAKRF